MSEQAQGAGAPAFTQKWEIDGVTIIDGVKVRAGIYTEMPEGFLDQSELICEVDYKYAHGIAALPDLIEALEEMRAEFRNADLPYGSRAYLMSGQALSKARGAA